MPDTKTAIERLRQLLDERGATHVGGGEMVRWVGKDGCVCRAYSRRGDLCLDVSITYVSPERAIDATLGRGTCHDASIGRHREYGTRFTCSECDADVDLLDDQNSPTIWSDGVGMHPRFCPNCGRRVVEVD